MEANNMKAMREALEQIRDMIMCGGFDGRSPAYIVNICDAALAKSPRNCDRFGGDIDKLREACARERGLNPEEDFPEVFAEWLLAPSTERKGASDGSK